MNVPLITVSSFHVAGAGSLATGVARTNDKSSHCAGRKDNDATNI